MRLFAILLIVLFAFETHLYAECNFMAATHKRQIPLKGASSSVEKDLIMRSFTFYPVQAFIEGSNLQIEFRELPCTVEVSIVNALTDEVVYSESCVATDNVVIGLDGLKHGEYRLEMSLDSSTTLLYGDFIF